MKFVLACYGSRGDVEPCVAVGRELLHRGHEVRMAVPPDMVGFVGSAGLEAVAYGLDTQAILEAERRFSSCLFRSFWRIHDLVRLWGEFWGLVTRCWREASATLTSLAAGADLLFTGGSFEEQAANVAEYHGIPLATLHGLPVRANGHVLFPILPSPLIRSAMTVFFWLYWRVMKRLEDTQRRRRELLGPDLHQEVALLRGHPTSLTAAPALPACGDPARLSSGNPNACRLS